MSKSFHRFKHDDYNDFEVQKTEKFGKIRTEKQKKQTSHNEALNPIIEEEENSEEDDYKFIDNDNGNIYNVSCSIAIMEHILKVFENFSLGITSPSIHSGRGLGLRKPESWFTDKLKEIKKHNPESTIDV